MEYYINNSRHPENLMIYRVYNNKEYWMKYVINDNNWSPGHEDFGFRGGWLHKLSLAEIEYYGL